MEKITALFDKLDLAKLVPEMDTLLEKMQWIAGVAVMVGPLVMLFLGLWYLLLPPKEANYSAGFRTWFGMGSEEAWRMTQKIAGFAWIGCGVVLSVVMWIISRGFANMELMDVAGKAFTCLLWQVGVAVVSYVAICLTVTILFDSRGIRRGRK